MLSMTSLQETAQGPEISNQIRSKLGLIVL